MRKARGERGQVLAIVALALVALLGISAFAIDVGYAYYAKRQLQSATDAAALAGAQDLPTAATAIATATTYATANTPANLSGLTFTYTTKCTATAIVATGCTAEREPERARRDRHGDHEHLVRQALRHRALQRRRARERLQPVLIDPGRHRHRDRPHRLDVHADRRATATASTSTTPRTACARCSASSTRRTRRSACSTSRRCRRRRPSVCSAPYNSLGGNGYDGYDAASRGYITDTINSNYKTGRRAEHLVGPRTSTRWTASRAPASRLAATPPTARRCVRPRPSCSRTGARTSRTTSSS